jgi:DNA-binding transcriptional LysR family regulator
MPRQASLSIELLRTFLLLIKEEGDAASTARILKINQPSMSKRLGYLQHAGPVLSHPWLVREGKTWKLTEEGSRALPAVEEIVTRYDQLQSSLGEEPARGPRVSFACGQQAAASFVHEAVRLLRQQQPDVRLRIATPRSRVRIERVANGSLDLAIVTHNEAAILEIAHRPLYTHLLTVDALVLVSAGGRPWSADVEALPQKVKPRALVGLPLLLPEPSAAPRKEFDEVMREKNLLAELDVVIEMGGWEILLGYVQEGAGVGVLSDAVVPPDSDLIVRSLDPRLFTPTETRLIARRKRGAPEEPDLSPAAQAFHDALLEVTASRRAK